VGVDQVSDWIYLQPTSACGIDDQAATVIMSFNTPFFNQQDKSFFNALNISKVVHVIIAAESEDFAEEVIQQWKAEGFNVIYVPFGNGGKDFVARVKYAGDNIGVSEQYAVVGNSHQSPRCQQAIKRYSPSKSNALQLLMKPPP
jgi:tryptophan synthase alpha subunit